MKLAKIIEKQVFLGKIAIICGGSKGIGKETAKYIVQMGGNVCLIARNQDNLTQAILDLESLKSHQNQKIDSIACDTTDKLKLEPLIEEYIKKNDVPDYLINTVGYAYPQYIHKLFFVFSLTVCLTK